MVRTRRLQCTFHVERRQTWFQLTSRRRGKLEIAHFHTYARHLGLSFEPALGHVKCVFHNHRARSPARKPLGVHVNAGKMANVELCTGVGSKDGSEEA